MINDKVRTRFAPSPTGYMHIGNLRTALYAYLFAKANGGDFILRIEDTDQSREVEGAVEVIYDTLKDTGLQHDEGPDVGGPYGSYVQSERKAIYQEYAKKLVELGGAYYCFCKSEDLHSELGEQGNMRYDKRCLRLPKEEVEARLARGDSYVIRQNIPLEGSSTYTDLVFGDITVDFRDLDDNILIKSDGFPTYNFANVIDDHLMKITHVIRGAEYLSSTPKYNLLYEAFGWEHPQYIHLPLIMKDEHQKLSKRNGDASYEDLIKKGFVKDAIINYIALLGWSPKDNEEKLSLEQLKEKFNIEGISKSQSIFDEPKLKWLNGLYLKEMDEEGFFKLAEPFICESKAAKYDHRKIAKLLQPRIEILSEIPEKIDFLAEFSKIDPALYFNKKQKIDENQAREMLPIIYDTLKDIDFTEENIHNVLMGLVEKLQVKIGAVMWPARIAITNKEVTPGGMVELATIIGKEETLNRLQQAMEWLKE